MVSTTFQGGWGVPGAGDAVETTERNIFWGGDWGKGQILTMSASFASTLADAGNTPTTDIRPGLLVAKLTSSGEMVAWDADADSTGAQNIWGINMLDMRMIDFNATASDRVAPVVVRAPLKTSQLLIQGTAFTSHVDEFLARRQLHSMHCILDDDPQGYKAGYGFRMETIADADITTSTTPDSYTITEAQNGTTFIFTSTIAAGLDIILPTIHPGLEYYLLRGADSGEDFVIKSVEGDNVIVGHDLQADSITWTTAGQMIGAGLVARAIYVGTALRWHFDLYTPPFGTGLTGGFAYAITTA